MKFQIINTDRIPLRQGYNGTWELRKRIKDGKRLEISLGTTDRGIAEERARQIVGAHVRAVMGEDWNAAVKLGLEKGGWLRRTHARMVTRSNLKGRKCMGVEALEAIAKRSGGYCEVSGIQFELGTDALHPFQPSVDRIDSSIGYEPHNVRLVCLSVNYCMSRWGEEIFNRIAAAAVSKRLAQMATVKTYSAQTGGNSKTVKIALGQ